VRQCGGGVLVAIDSRAGVPVNVMVGVRRKSGRRSRTQHGGVRKACGRSGHIMFRYITMSRKVVVAASMLLGRAQRRVRDVSTMLAVVKSSHNARARRPWGT